ncbi:MAG TPA: hypothetical protein VGM63_22045 [Mucilaginibacter sp.]|jgi:hypothetical protein
MNTIKLNSSINLDKEETAAKPYSIYKKFIDFADSQTEKRAAWFLISILGPGVLFLPIPAALMYYYDASVWTLAVTVVLFFASLVVGMGGSKIGVLIALLGVNIIVHISLILMYVL